MSRSPPPNDVLLLIDIQTGFDHPTYWGSRRSNASFQTNITNLLRGFEKLLDLRALKLSSPLHPSSNGINFQPYATPTQGELVIVKSVNSAFLDTNLEEMLRVLEVQRLFVAGLTTDHGVSTSVRMAADLGVTDHLDKETGELVKGRVILIEDATATWERGNFDAETVHRVQVASLKGEFCEVATTDEVLNMIYSTYTPT
ncbi:hypothetical protein MMC26_006982 [Xylographa opegraphella]|nr:hypothetical protein [Xylographa opegraphella]